MKRLCSIVLIFALGCGGCIPSKAYDAPEVKGQILDAATREPISNAQISIKLLKQPPLEIKTTSDVSGRFGAAEITHRIWLSPFELDQMPPDASIVISAAGYKTEQLDYLDELRRLNYPYPANITVFLMPLTAP